MLVLKKLFLSWLCGKKKEEKKPPSSFDNILINARFKIGDTIMLFVLIREIKIHYPLVNIDILAGKDNYFMFKNNPHINKIICFGKNLQFVKNLLNLKQLQNKNYDIVIDVSSIKFGNYLYLKLLHAKYLITLKSSNRYGINNKHCYDSVLKILPKQHNLDHFLSVLPLLGISINSLTKKLEIYLDSEARNKAEQFINSIREKKKKIVLLNVDGSNDLRSISKKDIQDILLKISEQFQEIIVVILTMPPRRQEVQNILTTLKPNNILLSYHTKNIFDVMSLVDTVDIVVTPDTSIIHIASALQKPFIGIYSQNQENFYRFSPIADNYKLIFAPHKKENSIQNFDKRLLLKTLEELIHATHN